MTITETTAVTATTLVLSEDEVFNLLNLDMVAVENELDRINGRIRGRRIPLARAAAAAYVAWLLHAHVCVWGGFVPNSYSYACPVPLLKLEHGKAEALRRDGRRSWGVGPTIVVSGALRHAVLSEDGCVDIIPDREAWGMRTLPPREILRAAAEGRIRGYPRIPASWVDA